MPIENIIPRLVAAGLAGDRRAVEALAIRAIRNLRPNRVELAKEIADALASGAKSTSALRAVGAPSVQLESSGSESAVASLAVDPELQPPILRQTDMQQVERLLQERRAASKLALEGLAPIRSAILEGPPGVGKTYLGHYFAAQLKLPLVTLDLAAVLSSLLGQTGQNIKSAFDAAANSPHVLLLDEFDAIGQERGATLDVGELRRIVSVILKELEFWPSTSLLVAATNHSELIDGAMWRRFDLRIRLQLPDNERRHLIWLRSLDELQHMLPSDVFDVLARITEGWSPADIVAVSQNIRKVMALERGSDPITASFEQVFSVGIGPQPRDIGDLIRLVWPKLNGRITQTQIGSWFGIKQATVSHHLRRGTS